MNWPYLWEAALCQTGRWGDGERRKEEEEEEGKKDGGKERGMQGKEKHNAANLSHSFSHTLSQPRFQAFRARFHYAHAAKIRSKLAGTEATLPITVSVIHSLSHSLFNKSMTGRLTDGVCCSDGLNMGTLSGADEAMAGCTDDMSL